jgi:hypothetical protein
MKLFAISALCALILISIIVLSGCAQSIIPTPTPFTTGEEVQPVKGCLMLREEVEKYNAKHPQSPKKADC